MVSLPVLRDYHVRAVALTRETATTHGGDDRPSLYLLLGILKTAENA
jgi:hypothetical protein